jgi:trimeric autotransporter adhesin
VRRSTYLALAFALALLALAPGAHAVPSSTPDATTVVPDDNVNAVLLDGDRLIIGGDFTRIGAPKGHGIPFNAASGAEERTFPFVNDDIDAVIPDGSGGWYIGGHFTRVGGVARNHLARIRADGTVDPGFDPDLDQYVAALALSGSKLYAGGEFTEVNQGSPTVTRNYLAAFDTATGAVDPAFDPNVDNTVYALALSGSTLYASGSFDVVNQAAVTPPARHRIAAFNTTNGTATGFDPNVDGDVRALLLSGTTLYAGGLFSTVNGATDRIDLAAFDTTTGTADAGFDPHPNGEVRALALSGSRLYAGGDFDKVNNDTADRIKVAAFDKDDGTVDPGFDPGLDLDSSGAVDSLTISGSKVYVGGTYTTVNTGGTPVTRNNLAAFDATTGVVDGSFDPNPNSPVLALALSGDTIYAGGFFVMTDGVTRNHVAALDASTGALDMTFDPDTDVSVSSLFRFGSRLYLGGSFNTVNQGTTPVNSRGVAVVDPVTGVADAGFDGHINGSVNAVVASATRVYAGGTFVSVGSPPHTQNRLASLDAATGARDTSFTNAGIGSTVNTLALSGSLLYAGGSFTAPRNRIAAFNPATGVLDATFDPNVTSTVEALLLNGATIYAGGSFVNTNNLTAPRNRLAEFNATSGAVQPFNPNVTSTVEALASDGTDLYAGGSFTGVAGNTLIRNRLAAFDPATAVADPGFAPDIGFFRVLAIAASPTMVWAGGQFEEVGTCYKPHLVQFSPPAVVPPCPVSFQGVSQPQAPGSPSGGPGGGGGQPGGAAAAKTGLKILGKSITATSSGKVKITLQCTGAGPCDGKATLETVGAFASAKKKRLKLASKKFSIKGGAKKKVTLKLSRKGKRLLARKRKLRVRLRVSAKDATGASAKASKKLTLKRAKKKKR